ncbi:hypothetical protein PHJA_000406300 [Phtheirospermum japonicum]|uniref:Transposase n=1 Tax=Phtheirospermum japonicum TaxID=374723 RepID=A0A830B9K9_9LAMI|nr:hypothetical protein PHJA_000406300 [Phtheirospermum japonicum]
MTKALKLDPAGCHEVLVNSGARVIIDMDDLRLKGLWFSIFDDNPNNISAAIMSRLTDTTQKKGRGITKGISVRKKIKKIQNRKLDITIHPRRNRIVGENAAEFKTEASAILKQHEPMQYARWKKNPTDRKKMLWLAMKQKFNLQENVEIKKVVFQQLNRQYRSLRHKLHDHYAKNKDDEKILEQPPDGITEVSDRNKRNRDKLKMAHTCGTKSIAQYCYEERDLETGQEPTRTSTWMKTRFSNKKKDWIDDASREAYEDIMKLQNEGGVDTEGPVSEDEAFIKVLGPEKPSRLRGCGDGLKPPSKRGESINQELSKENEELRKQADADRECLKRGLERS